MEPVVYIAHSPSAIHVGHTATPKDDMKAYFSDCTDIKLINCKTLLEAQSKSLETYYRQVAIHGAHAVQGDAFITSSMDSFSNNLTHDPELNFYNHTSLAEEYISQSDCEYSDTSDEEENLHTSKRTRFRPIDAEHPEACSLRNSPYEPSSASEETEESL